MDFEKKKEIDELSDASADNEFHDAEDSGISNEKVIEEVFSDALNLDYETEKKNENESQIKIVELSDEVLEDNKQKSIELKTKGNDVFKTGDYEKALGLYTQAIDLCADKFKNEKAILFNNRAAAQKFLGSKDAAIQDCTQAIELNPSYIRAYIRRAALFEETEKWNESIGDYQKVVELEPSNREARDNVQRLTPIVAEYNEKLKTEMIGKLKDLGNMILKPFGLSTNNFQLQQDPGTGSYSVNFKQ